LYLYKFTNLLTSPALLLVCNNAGLFYMLAPAIAEFENDAVIILPFSISVPIPVLVSAPFYILLPSITYFIASRSLFSEKLEA